MRCPRVTIFRGCPDPTSPSAGSLIMELGLHALMLDAVSIIARAAVAHELRQGAGGALTCVDVAPAGRQCQTGAAGAREQVGRVPCRLTLQSRVWRVHVAAGRCWLPTGVAASCSQARQYRLPLCTSQCTARGCCRLRRGCARRQVRAANPIATLASSSDWDASSALSGCRHEWLPAAARPDSTGCRCLQARHRMCAAICGNRAMQHVLPYVNILPAESRVEGSGSWQLLRTGGSILSKIKIMMAEEQSTSLSPCPDSQWHEACPLCGCMLRGSSH